MVFLTFILVAALPHKEYLKMSDKSTAKAMFTSLCLNYEGNKKVREAKATIVGTKGVSQNHLLSFDDNKVLKIINWKCKTFVQVYRIIIKVLFIKILIEQVKEQRNFIWSLKRLEECV